ncbi:MAG: tRNA (guanosine(37)-N1)-methyltransferase TrmD [Candidatus Moranbacteria bacterium]|nr:tRNA (guanosine(37)-N1)-methyltransferase TrmD [Candidatus Moranbacteria bacterium]
MQFHIVTIFPRILDSYLKESIIGRAQKSGAIEVLAHNLRDYTTDKHEKVDDTPYGGGAGMVLQVQPIYACVEKIKKLIAKNEKDNPPKAGPPRAETRIILFSAKGKKYTQRSAERLSKYDNLILICGRYEGVDERVAQHIADEEISIGDYVLTGGELPAMIIIDSVMRLLPGVLGNEESAKHESHKNKNYKEHPQYSKPPIFNDWQVPEVLMSGNHGEIKKWRSFTSRTPPRRGHTNNK